MKLLHLLFGCLLVPLLSLLLMAPAAAQEPAAQEPGPQAVSSEPEAGALGRVNLDRFEAYLDGVMTTQFRDYQLAGMTFALVLDGEPAVSRGFGFADLESRTPVDPSRHLFRPGSVSKLFTWTAVMQLVESGQLDLHAPVSNYVDQLEVPNAFGTPLTLFHILTHTPGFEDGAAGFLFADEASDIVPLAQSLASHVPDQIWEPGTYAAYNNFAAALAGLIVANVSGLSFEQYVRKEILEPLGMTHSTFDEPLPDNLAADFATGYVAKQGGLEPFGFEFIKNFGPAGALSATADDMERFIQVQVNGGALGHRRILAPETVRLMHSRLFAHDDRVAGMAHGFYEIRRNGERFVGHGGDTIAFHSELVLKPEDGFGFFLSFNSPDGAKARTMVTDAVIDFFYPGDRGASPAFPAEPLQGSEERIAKVAGAYRLNRRSFTALEGVVGLAGDLTIAPGSPGSIFVPAPQIGGRFVEVEPWVFRQEGRQQLLVFQENPDGEVSHAFIGSLPIMVGVKVPFVESASAHQQVIVLALLAALFVIINGVRNRQPTVTGAGLLAWRLSFANAVVIMAFVTGLALVFADADMEKLLFDFPPAGTGLVLVLPLVSALLVCVCAVLAVPVWRGSGGNLWQKLRYTYVTLVFALLILVFGYWNLLGWNY